MHIHAKKSVYTVSHHRGKEKKACQVHIGQVCQGWCTRFISVNSKSVHSPRRVFLFVIGVHRTLFFHFPSITHTYVLVVAGLLSSFMDMADAHFRLMVNLKVLSGLQEGDVLFTNGQLFEVGPRSLWTSMRRRWDGESRQKNLTAVVVLVNDGLALLFSYWAEMDRLQEEESLSLVLPQPGKETSLRVLHTRQQQIQQLRLHFTKLADLMAQVKLGLQHLSRSYYDDSTLAAQLRQTCDSIDNRLVPLLAAISSAPSASTSNPLAGNNAAASLVSTPSAPIPILSAAQHSSGTGAGSGSLGMSPHHHIIDMV